MALMLACLKNNDYEQKPCSRVIEAFNNCVRLADARREARLSGDPTNQFESRRIPSAQVNRALRKFPEP